MIMGICTERHASRLMPSALRTFSAYGDIG
jgi:hypothetical protein